MRAGRYIEVADMEQALREIRAAIPSYLNAHCPTAAVRAETRRNMERSLEWVESAMRNLACYDGILERADADHARTVW